MATSKSLKSSSRSQSTVKGPTELEVRFASYADQIGLTARGLLGARLYRDSQFELRAASDGVSESEKPVARAAFNRAFADRVAREFPGHQVTL